MDQVFNAIADEFDRWYDTLEGKAIFSAERDCLLSLFRGPFDGWLEVGVGTGRFARASLEELLADYRDFLRVRNLEEWPRDHPCTARLRRLNRAPGASYETFRKGIENLDQAICAKVIIGPIKLTSYLLDKQIRRLEQDFLKEGGLRERMTRARLAERDKQRNTREDHS